MPTYQIALSIVHNLPHGRRVLYIYLCGNENVKLEMSELEMSELEMSILEMSELAFLDDAVYIAAAAQHGVFSDRDEILSGLLTKHFQYE